MGKINLYSSSGIAVKPRIFTGNGKVNVKHNLDKVAENIRLVLMTSRGTQIGNPSFGSNLYRILGYGKTSATASMVRTEIQDVFDETFPELSLEKIDVDFDKNTILITIYYVIQYSNVNSNVVLEFINSEGGLING